MRTSSSRGFTILEVSVAMGISSAILLSIVALQINLIRLGPVIRNEFMAQDQVRKMIKNFSAEIRSASSAANGAYPIAAATATSITFYADADKNGVVERIRYYVSGTTLRRGVIVPSGNPATYNVANETTAEAVADITNGAGTIFEYYDATYNGTSAALTIPVTLSSIRLVKITVTVDKGGSITPGPKTYSTQTSIRNLKDNL